MLPFIFAKLNLYFFAAACTNAQVADLNKNDFFFFPHWWKYLKTAQDSLGNCVPQIDFPNGIWLIGLAVLDSLLALAGFVAVISIMVAGAQLVLAEGNPEKATNARNRLINSLIGLAIAVSATALVALIGNTVGGNLNPSGLPNVAATPDTIQSILNILFAIMGAAAFFYIVLSGFRYISSSDNPTKVAEARRQILYAALGLLVIVLASAIVNFVLGKLK